MTQRFDFRNSLIGTLIFMAAHTAEGQYTDKVEIVLGACTVEHVWVVLDGDEDGVFEATPSRFNNKVVGTWKKKPATFDAAHEQASLRLGGKRTDCQPSKAVKDDDPSNKWGYVAQFTFSCDQQPVRRVVKVQSHPLGFPFHYDRQLSKSRTIAGSRNCTEGATFEGTKEILDLRLNEKLFLRFPPESKEPGLYIHEILERLEVAKSSAPVSLSSGAVVHILSLQRASGDYGSASNFSTAAMDIDELHVVGLTSVSLAVH